MQLSHTSRTTSAVFDDPNLVSSAGLKVASLVMGMVAGADSIEDMALLRHGGMGRVFTRAYAPSTLGSFLRSFTFGHLRQLDAIASGVPERAGGPLPAGGRDREPRAGRRRRHHHRGARLRQAGLGLRLLRGPRAERAAGPRDHRRRGTGDRRAAAAQGLLRVTAGRERLSRICTAYLFRLVGLVNAGAETCGGERRCLCIRLKGLPEPVAPSSPDRFGIGPTLPGMEPEGVSTQGVLEQLHETASDARCDRFLDRFLT